MPIFQVDVQRAGKQAQNRQIPGVFAMPTPHDYASLSGAAQPSAAQLRTLHESRFAALSSGLLLSLCFGLYSSAREYVYDGSGGHAS